MADNKSSEVIKRIRENEFEYNLVDVNDKQINAIIELYKKHNSKSVGSITVDIDCSDALKGLKAIQREAKKATAALKELDDIQKHTCPECKTISLDIQNLRADDIVLQKKQCQNCGWSND